MRATRERGILGVPILATFACQRGRIERTPWGVRMHPSDHMRMRNGGQVPLFTRHMLGVREAERATRKRNR